MGQYVQRTLEPVIYLYYGLYEKLGVKYTMKDDKFKFNLPIDIVKSSDPEKGDEWRIGGYASTSDEDRQGDEIVQKGLDYSDFVNHGWFNYDHDNSKILGYPDKSKCRVDSKGFYVEGTLLKDVSIAKSMWETALALKKSGSDRKLGFSVEGKILKRNDLGQVVKAKIYNVAITANPVNTSCNWEALVKSFTTNPCDLEKSEDTGVLQAGHNDSNGSCLVPESLDSAFKILSYAIGDDDESKKHMEVLKKKLSNKQDISKSELILYLQLVKGLSLEKSTCIANKLSQLEE